MFHCHDKPMFQVTGFGASPFRCREAFAMKNKVSLSIPTCNGPGRAEFNGQTSRHAAALCSPFQVDS
jgi:hypothetical protein